MATLLPNPELDWGWHVLLLVQVTSMMMRRIPRRWWHSIHLLSSLLFAAATVHGLQAGPDNTNMFVIVVIVGSSAILLFVCSIRLAFMRVKQHRRA
ncbi:MAG: hypothetical protein WCC60_03500 [Ilumatobacteraceae bacterium]